MDLVHRHSLWILFAIILFIPCSSRAANVTLAWDANTEPNVAGYNLYYGTSSGSYSSAVSLGPQTTYTVTGLQSGTWYFAVTARDTTGAESSYSNETSKVVDATPPLISSVKAINILSSGATITWTTDEPSDSQVEYGLTTAYGTLTAVNATMVNAHSQALPGLASSTLYHYRVKSTDAAGNQSVSPDLTFTTAQSLDITPPAISGVSSSGIDSSRVQISWTTNEASDTQVQYGLTVSYGQSTVLDPTGMTAHSVILSGLTAGSVYHFRVLSRDSAGNLAASGDFTFSTAASTATIPAFVQMNSSQITTGSSLSISFPASNTAGNLIVVYVIWDNSSPVTISDSLSNSYFSAIGPTKYSGDRANAQIFYAKGIAGGTNTLTATFSTAISTWGIVYIHEYSGIDTASPLSAATAGSGSASVMNSGSLTTTIPNSLLFAGGESSNVVTLGTNLYTVRSNQYGNLTEDWVAAQPGTYSATATQNSSAWVLQLVAFKPLASSAADTTPPQISSVGTTGATSSAATITWTTDEASDSQVEYGPSTAYGNSTVLNSSLVTVHSVSLTGLTPGGTYHYRVRSKDSAGNPAVSADYSFTTASLPRAVPKFVQERESSTSRGSRVSVRFPNSNTAGNLVVAYVVWDNSGPVTITDTAGNPYSSAIAATSYGGTSAQIFYARNIAGGLNTVTATFSTPITGWGILYVHEYSGLDKAAPLDSATAGAGSSNLINSGTLVTSSPNALLFGGGESSGTVDLGSNGFSTRSKKYGNLTQDKVAALPGAYSAAISQDSNACIFQLVAFRAAVQQTTQTTMALPLMTSATQINTTAGGSDYVGLAVVNSDAAPATLTFTAMDSAGQALTGPGISNPTVRTVNPGEQLRIVDRQLFGDGIADSASDGWIKLESTTPRIGGQYAILDKDSSEYQGAEISTELLQTIILPEIGAPGATQLTVVNPSQEAGTVSIDIVKADGSMRASTTRTIGPEEGWVSESVPKIMGGAAPQPTDYIRVRASAALYAFELVRTTAGNFTLLNGLDQGAGASVLYGTQYPYGIGTQSGLAIINLDSKQGNIHLRLVGDDAQQIGDTRDLPIESNGKIYIEDPQFFGVPADAAPGQAYVEIRSDEVRLAGSVTFYDPARQKSASSLPLATGLKDTVFLSNMTQDELFSSAITLLNPGDNDVSAKVELYDSAGTLLASAADSIPPHQRSSRPICEYFPQIAGPLWTSGYIAVHTDSPVAAFSTVASAGAGVIGVVPSQQVP